MHGDTVIYRIHRIHTRAIQCYLDDSSIPCYAVLLEQLHLTIRVYEDNFPYTSLANFPEVRH